MMHSRRASTIAGLLALGAVALLAHAVLSTRAAADPPMRTWAKVRYGIHDLDGNRVAENSVIITRDEYYPHLMRVLIADVFGGKLFVMRSEVHADGAIATSVERTDGSQLVRFAVDAQENGTLEICGGSLPFDDSVDKQPTSVLDASDALLAACDAGQQAEIERVIVLGLHYEERLQAIAQSLQGFLRDYEPLADTFLGRSTKLGVVFPFDPGECLKDSFEQQFPNAFAQ